MSETGQQRRVSFRTKVLVPVILVMVLLVAATMAVVNLRFKAQLQRDTARQLITADDVFRSSQKIRSRNLLLRYGSAANSPRVRAVMQSADPKTIQRLLGDLQGEFNAGIVCAAIAGTTNLVRVSRDADLDLSGLSVATAKVASRALDGQASADIVELGGRLVDAVAVPVQVEDQLVGALVFGSELNEQAAMEFRQLTDRDVVLLSGGKVAATTFRRPDLYPNLAALYKRGASRANGTAAIEPAEMAGEHYLAAVGRLPTLGADAGYILLSSYEESLRGLHETQRLLILIALAGIALSSAIVWLLINSVTAPLRQLTETAEAVGRGDFSRRVDVASRDETGELAQVFNRMTENLQTSHAELQKTVVDLKTTQEQLVQSEKLSGIGEFVAGVTHELNNPLTCIIGFAELMEEEPIEGQLKEDVLQIVNNAHRCRRIVRSLLSFARQHTPERKSVSINELIEQTLEIVAYQLRTSSIEVLKQLDPALPRVWADPHQVQQVFINLINNARQAIEDHQPSGKLVLTTERGEGLVRIRIQDNGPGISEANLQKLFTPFFTTKEVGKGTGLGLSLCYGIVKEHGGTIVVTSKPGEGALFTIVLPVGEAAGASKETDGGAEPAALDGAGRNLLVVDDEDSIQSLVRTIAESVGFRVDAARDGATALRFLRQSKYDVVLCDLKMPGMTGEQVYEALRVIDPVGADRLIFITGDVVNDKTQQFVRHNGVVCVAKPFTPDELRTAVRKVLSRQ